MSQHPTHLSQPFGGFYQPVAQFAAQSAPAHGPLFPPPSPAHGPLLPPPVTPYRPSPSPRPWGLPPSTPILDRGSRAPSQAPAPSPAPTPAPKEKKDKAYFSEMDKEIMAEMLIEDKLKGTAQGGHKNAIWQAIADRLNTQITQGAFKDVRNCQSQITYIRPNYWEPIHNMLSLSGFGWDPERNLVVAEEAVWEPYLKAHPEALKWKTKRWPQYELWNKLFEGSKAHGKNVVRPGRPFVGVGRQDGEDSDGSSHAQDTEDGCLVPDSQASRDGDSELSSGSKGKAKRKAPAKVSGPESILTFASKMEALTEVAREAVSKKKRSSADRLDKATQFISDIEWLFAADKVKVLNMLASHPSKVVLLVGVMGKEELSQGLIRSWLDE